MYPALNPGAIGLGPLSLRGALAAARQAGFAGLDLNAREVAGLVALQGVAPVAALFAEMGARPAGWGLPVRWSGEAAAWKSDLADLPAIASAMRAIGAERAVTYFWSFSDERPFAENWRFHHDRLAPVATILTDHGCRLGLEFLGPSSLRAGRRYVFVHRLDQALELAADIGSNVGLLLDAWHWHASGGTVAEIEALRSEQVVHVHVNDAPAGLPREALVDTTRALPGETGAIDIVGFLRALHGIGYDGPVTPEPFKAELKELPSDTARLEVVATAMRVIFERAGLGGLVSREGGVERNA